MLSTFLPAKATRKTRAIQPNLAIFFENRYSFFLTNIMEFYLINKCHDYYASGKCVVLTFDDGCIKLSDSECLTGEGIEKTFFCESKY